MRLDLFGHARAERESGLLSGEDEVLTPVDEFPGRVEMAGVAGGLGQDRKDRCAQVALRQVGEDLYGPPNGTSVQRGLGEDLVAEADLLAVGVEYVGRWSGVLHLPGGVAGGQLHLFAGDNGSEPEPLDVERQMLYEPEAGPPRRQDRAAQLGLRRWRRL